MDEFLFHEEWKALINGKKEEVLTAYGAYMALQLGAGVSEIDLRYRPYVVYYSLAISLLTLFVLIMFTISRKNQKHA